MFAAIYGEDLTRVRKRPVDAKDFKVIVGNKEVTQFYFSAIWMHDYLVARLFEGKKPEFALVLKKIGEQKDVKLLDDAELHKSEFTQENILKAYDALAAEPLDMHSKCGIFAIPNVGFAYFRPHPLSESTQRDVADNGDNMFLFITGIRILANSKVTPEVFIGKLMAGIKNILFPSFPLLEYIQFEKISTFGPFLAKEPYFCTLNHRLYTVKGFLHQPIGMSILFASQLKITCDASTFANELQRRVMGVDDSKYVTATIYNGETELGSSRVKSGTFVTMARRGGWHTLTDFMVLHHIIQTLMPIAIIEIEGARYVLTKDSLGRLRPVIAKYISPENLGLVDGLPAIVDLIQKPSSH